MLRATLKGMLSRKLRLTLSTLAVVLGVMFVSGAFVLTDTVNRSFQNLFTTIYDDIDIQVTRPTSAISLTGQPVQANVPGDRVPVVADVPGVARAVGGIFVDGAKVVDRYGKVVPTTGAPRYGGAWIDGDDLVSIRPGGRPPAADDEIMISANLAETTRYAIGDTVEVLTTLDPVARPYTVVGIVGYTGGRDSMAGETIVYFTEPVAQQRMLGETGVFSEISVVVEPGADLATVRDAIAAALGPEYAVRTGEDLAAESASSIEEGLRFFNYLLLGFAGIALFVGIFIIINTFSITIAQRTRELALLRAIGAARNQVVWSVLAEALVVGLIASVVGLVLGVVVGLVLGIALGSLLSDGNLELAGVALTPAHRRHPGGGPVAGVAGRPDPARRGHAGVGHAGPAAHPAHRQRGRRAGGRRGRPRPGADRQPRRRQRRPVGRARRSADLLRRRRPAHPDHRPAGRRRAGPGAELGRGRRTGPAQPGA
jgi:putative ABC transport system permease protein